MNIENFINRIICGDAKDVLKQFPNESVDLTVTSPPYDCYSDDTEVLTKDGWKPLINVNKNDTVLTLNPNNKNTYFCKVVDTFKYYVNNEDLIHFKSQDIDLLVTKNHRMYVEGSDGLPVRERIPFVKKKNLKSSYFKNASDIKSSDKLPASGFKYIDGEHKKYFILPEVDCIYRKKRVIFPSKKIPMIWWIRFLGIWIAEGSARGTKGGLKNGRPKAYEVNIKQKNKYVVGKIREILKNLPFNYREYYDASRDEINFSITDRQLWEYLFKIGNSHTKYVPSEIKNLDKEYLEEFLYYYLLGDGSNRSKVLNKKSMIINKFKAVKSSSKRLRDDIQEIGIKIGFYTKQVKNNFVSFTSYNRLQYANINKSIEKYTGNVVCIQVEKDNIIFVRRNGKAVFCGNSLRLYKGYEFDFKAIANELYRVTKKGGVVVWVVGDATINGSETGTSFKQALYFKDIGFNLHDTMIYEKNGPTVPSTNRYHQVFEYMFIFSKGKPKTINLLRDRKNLCGNAWGKRTIRGKDGKRNINLTKKPYGDYGLRFNIWKYNTGYGFGSSDEIAYKHPAIFPDKLAEDHIRSWSNEGDVVLDPMCGSGTTCKMAKKLKRKYIGIDISEEYCELARLRVGGQKKVGFENSKKLDSFDKRDLL